MQEYFMIGLSHLKGFMNFQLIYQDDFMTINKANHGRNRQTKRYYLQHDSFLDTRIGVSHNIEEILIQGKRKMCLMQLGEYHQIVS